MFLWPRTRHRLPPGAAAIHALIELHSKYSLQGATKRLIDGAQGTRGLRARSGLQQRWTLAVCSTDLGPISRPPSQKSAGPAYMYAPHNSKCGTNRTQAHPHNTEQCTFCTHFTFALTISTYTPNWALKFLDPLHKKVPDQHICMHPTIPSVVPIEPRHIPTIQNSALFALISHSHSP